MGEYEWWEDRITPGFHYINQHPKTPIDFFCDAGHGHFDYSDELISYIAMFIKKAAARRLPANMPLNKPAQLKFIDPAGGWLMDRWRKDSLPIAPAAPYKNYKGDRRFSSWVFDKEMADATGESYAASRGKKLQYLGFMQNDEIVRPDQSHANYNLKFIPEKDGITFHVSSFFTDSSRIKPASEHASTPIAISRICGPVKKINDTTFQLNFYRMGFNNPKRSSDIWLLASNKDDAIYKGIVQQADLRFPLWNKEGEKQQIIFNAIPNQAKSTKSLKLHLPQVFLFLIMLKKVRLR